MATGLPALIIGVGGTGLRVLQRVKERLIETYYGEVPSQITLLAFDTVLPSPTDNFVGVQLTQNSGMYGSSALQQEFQLIQSHPSFTMDDVLAEARQGVPRWSWLEVNKLDQLLPPHSRSISDGISTSRPIGRTAFFLNCDEVRQTLQRAMQQVLQPVDPGAISNTTDLARVKRNVFLVGSLAGGTGSGAFIDVATLIRSIKRYDNAFSDIVLIGIVVLPRFFAHIQDHFGRRVPNTYAGLRELDRFMRGHKAHTPYHYVGGHGEEVKVENQLFDLCYLVDIEDYAGRPAGVKPDLGGLPAIADVIVAHTDLRLGLRLNAANSNVAANYALPMTNVAQASPFGLVQPTPQYDYQYQSRRYYSALNCYTVIFPREDVAKSLSLRFLVDFIDSHMIARDQRGQLMVPDDPIPVNALVEFLAKSSPTIQDRLAAQGEVEGKEPTFYLGIFVQTMLQYRDRRFDTSPEFVLKWLVDNPQTRKAVFDSIRRSLEMTTKDPADSSNMHAYVNKVRSWQEKYLGQLVDPHNLFGNRVGGAWEKGLGDLVPYQRTQMDAYVQTMMLSILNQRQETPVGTEQTSLMRANRLNYLLTFLRKLKDGVRAFIRQADLSFGATAKQVLQLRRDLEEHRARVVTFRGPSVPMFNPHPGPAYLQKLRELAEAECQHMLHTLVVAVAVQFGGDIASTESSPSVLDTAIQSIERWAKRLDKVREQIAEERGRHEARRKEKYAIGVRSYLTDPQKFPKAAEVEEELYRRYKPLVLRTLIGPDPLGEGGAFVWTMHGAEPKDFDYQIVTKPKGFKLHPYRNAEVFNLFGATSGVEDMAHEWQAGSFRLMAEHIRSDKVARVAAYLPKLYADQTALLGSVMAPHNKALVRLQNVAPSDRQRELYLAIDPTSDDLRVADFYRWFGQKWKSTEQNQDFLEAESAISCTFLTLYHGLELDHFHGFNAGEKSYRAMVNHALHLFPEERLAAEYEAQIPVMKRNDWGEVKRLHPEVVIGLGASSRVRSFAHALVCGLIETISDDVSHELYLALPEFYLTKAQQQRLTHATDIHAFFQMGPNDQTAARVLQAFQTYTLVGKPVDDLHGFHSIDYNAVAMAFQLWFNEQHKGKSGSAIDQLLTEWETNPNGLIAPLFHSEGKDPRFRDLGIVLMLELNCWRQLFN